jgi:hypothetical protein
MAEELRVIDQLYDFLLWTHRHIEKFPRASKYSVGSRVEATLLEVLHLLISAKFSKRKEEFLFRAGICLEENRLLWRLCKDLRLINLRSHEYTSKQLTDLSKQVQGWRRSSLPSVDDHEA